MRFYNGQHQFYSGIDLQARTMHLCVLDHGGRAVFDRNLPCRPDSFLRASAPFRDGLVGGAECMTGGCPHAEPPTNWASSLEREPAVLKGRRGVRARF